uniref:C2H2-type domain-containing protein n=1 Tax=Wuchereria bancrofti TaxID=6293 RepID=A0A1I8EAN8_WUCBA
MQMLRLKKLFYRPTETPCAPTGASIPSVLKQVKHVDTEIEGRGPGQQSAIDQQHITKDFLISSKNSKPASIISTSIVPIDENPVKNARKDEMSFLWTYDYLTTLRAHERVHNIDEPYKCNRCSESFHYMCELDYHAKQHSGKQYFIAIHQNFKGYMCEAKHFILIPICCIINIQVMRIKNQSLQRRPLLMLAYHMYGHRGEKILNPRVSRYLMARTENSYIIPGP